MQITITQDTKEYIVKPIVKAYKPGLLHKLGICHKSRLGYHCHGHIGECN